MKHGRWLAALLGVLLWGAAGRADITNTTPYDYDQPPAPGHRVPLPQRGFQRHRAELARTRLQDREVRRRSAGVGPAALYESLRDGHGLVYALPDEPMRRSVGRRSPTSPGAAVARRTCASGRLLQGF